MGGMVHHVGTDVLTTERRWGRLSRTNLRFSMITVKHGDMYGFLSTAMDFVVSWSE